MLVEQLHTEQSLQVTPPSTEHFNYKKNFLKLDKSMYLIPHPLCGFCSCVKFLW